MRCGTVHSFPDLVDVITPWITPDPSYYLSFYPSLKKLGYTAIGYAPNYFGIDPGGFGCFSYFLVPLATVDPTRELPLQGRPNMPHTQCAHRCHHADPGLSMYCGLGIGIFKVQPCELITPWHTSSQYLLGPSRNI